MFISFVLRSLYLSIEGEDCEIQFAESVLMPAAQAYRKDRPDYDPNYDDPDDVLQFYIALDVSTVSGVDGYMIILYLIGTFVAFIYHSVKRPTFFANLLV